MALPSAHLHGSHLSIPFAPLRPSELPAPSLVTGPSKPSAASSTLHHRRNEQKTKHDTIRNGKLLPYTLLDRLEGNVYRKKLVFRWLFSATKKVRVHGYSILCVVLLLLCKLCAITRIGVFWLW